MLNLLHTLAHGSDNQAEDHIKKMERSRKKTCSQLAVDCPLVRLNGEAPCVHPKLPFTL